MDKKIDGKELFWRVNTPQLLKEILVNSQVATLSKPITIFSRLLAQISEVSIKLHSPALAYIMCKLAMYEESDPYSKEFSQDKVDMAIDIGTKNINLLLDPKNRGGSLLWLGYDIEDKNTHPTEIGRYMVSMDDGVLNYEKWDGSKFVHNNKAINYWSEVQAPKN